MQSSTRVVVKRVIEYGTEMGCLAQFIHAARVTFAGSKPVPLYFPIQVLPMSFHFIYQHAQ